MCSNCADPENQAEPPIETLLNSLEHGWDGVRYVDASTGYEGHVYACLCGELFVDRHDLTEHITEALGFDPLDEALSLCAANYARLRATRDTAAIRRVTQGIVRSIDELGGIHVKALQQ